MAKTTLPEISNWIRKNPKAIYHNFSFSSSKEKKNVHGLLKTFVANHSNYYICEKEDKLILVKQECQIT